MLINIIINDYSKSDLRIVVSILRSNIELSTGEIVRCIKNGDNIFLGKVSKINYYLGLRNILKVLSELSEFNISYSVFVDNIKSNQNFLEDLISSVDGMDVMSMRKRIKVRSRMYLF